MARYQSRISGPLLDRIDIQIEVAAMPASAISGAADGESSAVIAERVARAHQRQLERQGHSNQRLGTREIDQYCKPDADGARILQTAMTHLQWSARSYHRVLKVARTIADLAGADGVTQVHVAEAIQYRRGLRAG